jgi:hypothetical protein
MSDKPSIEIPSTIGTLAVVILALALWAMSFSHSCASDGCIGIAIPGGGAAIALAIQLFVLVPTQAYRRRRSGKPLHPSLLVWILMSIAAFGIPIAFVK